MSDICYDYPVFGLEKVVVFEVCRDVNVCTLGNCRAGKECACASAECHPPDSGQAERRVADCLALENGFDAPEECFGVLCFR